MLLLAFSERITVVLTYTGAFSLVAFPLPGQLFFVILGWFTFLLHKSQVPPEPLNEKLPFSSLIILYHFSQLSFSS